MKLKQLLTFSFVLLVNFTFSQAGLLDPTFNSTGPKPGNLVLQPGNIQDVGHAIECLPDTSYLVLTTTYNGNATRSAVLHILQDGSTDIFFGDTSRAMTRIGTSTFGYDMYVYPNGDFLVAGIAYVTISDAAMFVSKFKASGQPDTTFGSGGYALYNPTSLEETAEAMVVLSNGNILIGGDASQTGGNNSAIACFDPTGQPVTSFGTNGAYIINAGSSDDKIYDLAELADGTIIGVGYASIGSTQTNACLIRINANGTPAAFGSSGYIYPALNASTSYAYGIVADGNNFYFCGQKDQGSQVDLYVAKYTNTGNPVNSFGFQGVSSLNPQVVSRGFCVRLQPDGKVVVAGTTGAGGFGNRDFIVARFTTAGATDPSFGTSGYTISNIGNWDDANGMCIAVDGKILTAGMSQFTNNDLSICRFQNDITSSVGVNEIASNNYELFPNPSSLQQVFINGENLSGEYTVRVYNLQGSMMEQCLISAQNNALEISFEKHLSKGLYVVEVSNAKSSTNLKMIIQ